MNKKGFTLVELLTVIVILAALSIIAIPNVIDIVNNNKKDIILSDAQKLVTLAKYKISTADNALKERCQSTCDLSFSELNTSGDINKDPEGEDYLNTSYVRYTNTNGINTYCIYLEGSKNMLGTTSNCISEDNLFNRNLVIDK